MPEELPDAPPAVGEADQPPPDTLEDRAVRIYRMIEGVGWNISKRGPIPDDGWPIDIIKREIEAIVGEHGRWLRELLAEIRIRDDTIAVFQQRERRLEDYIAQIDERIDAYDRIMNEIYFQATGEDEPEGGAAKNVREACRLIEDAMGVPPNVGDSWMVAVISTVIESATAPLKDAVESADRVIDDLNRRLALFEAEIVRLGEQGNSCTYDVLDKICAGCKCGRADDEGRGHELPG
jgi:hypothetical protein